MEVETRLDSRFDVGFFYLIARGRTVDAIGRTTPSENPIVLSSSGLTCMGRRGGLLKISAFLPADGDGLIEIGCFGPVGSDVIIASGSEQPLYNLRIDAAASDGLLFADVPSVEHYPSHVAICIPGLEHVEEAVKPLKSRLRGVARGLKPDRRRSEPKLVARRRWLVPDSPFVIGAPWGVLYIGDDGEDRSGDRDWSGAEVYVDRNFVYVPVCHEQHGEVAIHLAGSVPPRGLGRIWAGRLEVPSGRLRIGGVLNSRVSAYISVPSRWCNLVVFGDPIGSPTSIVLSVASS